MLRTASRRIMNADFRYFSLRLREAFAVLHTAPLTVIEAPMGYGKTMAAREFLGKTRARVVWTAILDSSVESCWNAFCRELARTVPEASDTAQALLRLDFPHDFVRADAACELLARVDFAKATVLAFDGTHFLSEREGGRAFARFCELLAQSGISRLRLCALPVISGPEKGGICSPSREFCLLSVAKTSPLALLKSASITHVAASASARAKPVNCMTPPAVGSALFICTCCNMAKAVWQGSAIRPIPDPKAF